MKPRLFQSNLAQPPKKILCKSRICCRGVFRESPQDSLLPARKSAQRWFSRFPRVRRKDTHERFYFLRWRREGLLQPIFGRRSRRNPAGDISDRAPRSFFLRENYKSISDKIPDYAMALATTFAIFSHSLVSNAAGLEIYVVKIIITPLLIKRPKTVTVRNLGKSWKSDPSPEAEGKTHNLFHRYPFVTATKKPGILMRPTVVPAVTRVASLTRFNTAKSIEALKNPTVANFERLN